jgi:hypothetical protein
MDTPGERNLAKPRKLSDINACLLGRLTTVARDLCDTDFVKAHRLTRFASALEGTMEGFR